MPTRGTGSSRERGRGPHNNDAFSIHVHVTVDACRYRVEFGSTGHPAWVSREEPTGWQSVWSALVPLPESGPVREAIEEAEVRLIAHVE